MSTKFLPGFERASLFVLHHHEVYDGNGYPARLRGDETPIGARIVAIIDAFDAMISSRPYRRGMPITEAIGRLASCAGTKFDPVLTPAFLRIATSEVASVFEATA